MPVFHSKSFNLLSPRERDCLRLLAIDFRTRQVASDLGISMSTLNKHLASVRQKLGFSRTAQAILEFERHEDLLSHDPASSLATIEHVANQSRPLSDLASSMYSCSNLDEASDDLLGHASSIGAMNMTFGLVAEPPGCVTNGARILRCPLSNEKVRRYNEGDAAITDPLVMYIVNNKGAALFDNRALVQEHGHIISEELLAIIEGFINIDCQYLWCQSYRDEATGAPLTVVFGLQSQANSELQNHFHGVDLFLQRAVGIYWNFIQSRQLLRQYMPLRRRHRQVLKLAARGFSVMETFRHLGMSVRSIEKSLAGARDQLGASTTASAVYRATVYRALS